MKGCEACHRWTLDDKTGGSTPRRYKYGKCSMFGEATIGSQGAECKAFLERGQEYTEVAVAVDFWRRPGGATGYKAEGNADFDMESAQPDVVIRATVPVPKAVDVEGFVS